MPLQELEAHVSLAYIIVRALIRLLLPTQMRLRARGAERCPRTGPLIIVANHLGLLDPLAIGVHVRRQIYFLAKAEIFAWPVIGGVARMCGVVPVHRGASDREAVRILNELLAEGKCVMLMPEGTYPKVPLPPAMLPAKTGAAYLAVKTGAPVLPVAITGTERVWYRARGWKIWHHPRVSVTFGEPYMPQVPAGMGAKLAYHAVADEMGRHIAALLPPIYRGHYAAQVATPVTTPASSGGLSHEEGLGQDPRIE